MTIACHELHEPRPLSKAVPSARRARRVLTLAFGASVLVALALLADLHQVKQALLRTNLVWLLPAFLLYLIQLGVLAVRWSNLARQLGLPLKGQRAFGEYALSVFLNQVLPSGMAGDAVRAARHARQLRRTGLRAPLAVEALALDRACGQLALLAVAIATAPLGLWRAISGPVTEFGAYPLGIALVLSACPLLWLVRTPQRLPVLGAVQAWLRRAGRLLLSPKSLALHLPLSLVFIVATLLQYYVAAQAVSAPLTLAQLAWLGPAVLLAASLPSLIGGWGAREGAAVLLFATAGLPMSLGLSVSIAYGLFSLAVAVAALPLWWLLRETPA